MDPHAIEEKIVTLWGDDLTGPAGVLHVTAVGRGADGSLAVIRIDPEAPASSTDFFALSVARARADAIITTGAILRAESEVSHDPGPDLRAWRREVLGKSEAAQLFILTRANAIPTEHPALRNPGVFIATGSENTAALEPELRPHAVGVLALARASLRGLIDELRKRNMATICIEAGPSTSNELYDEPLAVDELMLSLYEEATLPAELVAGPFLDERELREKFGDTRYEVEQAEQSGRWSFLRFRAARPNPSC